MSFWQWLKRATVNKAHPRDPVLAQWFGGGMNTTAGMAVTSDQAMRLAAVYACVRILSSAAASLPLEIYRRAADDTRERATDHWLYSLLHNRPNPWQTSYEWREMQMAHLLLRGNAYSWIGWTQGGRIDRIVPLHPDLVSAEWNADETEIVYRYQSEKGPAQRIVQRDMYHLRGLGFDMLRGLNPIEYTRETLGLALASEQFGAAFFGNGTSLGGVLEHPGHLDDQAQDRLRQSLEKFRGASNAQRAMVLEEGMTWKPLGIAPEQAQFLETRGFQVEEIARLFGVPPHMIAHTAKDTSWGSGIEQQGIGFVVYSLRPWLVRQEQAISRDLIAGADAGVLYAEHNVDALLRGDAKSRSEYYASAITTGWMTRNEARRKENMNPLDGLDEPLRPLNLGDGGEDIEDPTEQVDDRAALLRKVHGDQFGRAIDRIVTAEVRALRRSLEKSGGDMDLFNQLAAEFYLGHKGFVARHLNGLVDDPGGYAEDLMISGVGELEAARQRGEVDRLLSDWDSGRAARLYIEHADAALASIGG
ncbi:MAG: phage portal protein [Woeseiaceae bacterium]